MTKRYFAVSAIAVASLCAAFPCDSFASASKTDRTFVGKVGQGGMYEVIASRFAEVKASAPNVKDIAITEVHDHSGVNRNLKKIAMQNGVMVPAMLNSKFRQRLMMLKSVPTAQFDAAYIADMQKIHAKDEKLFAQEAISGSRSFRTFAHQTDLIVKRHIGALHGLDK